MFHKEFAADFTLSKIMNTVMIYDSRCTGIFLYFQHFESTWSYDQRNKYINIKIYSENCQKEEYIAILYVTSPTQVCNTSADEADGYQSS